MLLCYSLYYYYSKNFKNLTNYLDAYAPTFLSVSLLAGRYGFRSLEGQGFWDPSRQAPSPLSLLYYGDWLPFQRVKRLELDFGHLISSNAEIVYRWNYISTPSGIWWLLPSAASKQAQQIWYPYYFVSTQSTSQYNPEIFCYTPRITSRLLKFLYQNCVWSRCLFSLSELYKQTVITPIFCMLLLCQ
jgi:hypothetical protein